MSAVVFAIECADDRCAPVATTRTLSAAVLSEAAADSSARWALLEGLARAASVVLLSAPERLKAPAERERAQKLHAAIAVSEETIS